MDANKLDFIKKGAIVRGINLENFMSYLSAQKENGSTLSNWNIAELKGALDKYDAIVKNKAPPIEQKKEEEVKVKPPATTIQAPPTALATSPYAAPDKVTTKRAPYSALCKDNVQIKIIDALQKTGSGIFKTTHNFYIIETIPYGWKVEREYKNMIALRQILHKQFPGSIIPPLPKSFFEGENKDVIQYRKKYLQTFFDQLITDKAIMSYDLVEKFMQIGDRKELEALLNSEDPKKGPMSVKDMTHEDGFAHVKLSPELVTGSVPIPIYISKAKEVYSKAYALSSEIAGQFESLALKMTDLRNQFDILNKLSSFLSITELDFSYKSLSDTLNGLSEFTYQQGLVFSEYLQGFLQYQVHEFESMQELQDLMKKFQKAYVNADKKLTSKKEDLFKEKKIAKWQIEPQFMKMFSPEALMKNKEFAFANMLPKETEETQGLFISYGYYTNRLRTEMTRIHTQKAASFVKNYSKMVEAQKKLVDQYGRIWDKMGEHFRIDGMKGKYSYEKEEKKQIKHDSTVEPVAQNIVSIEPPIVPAGEKKEEKTDGGAILNQPSQMPEPEKK